ncbi:DUF937 domain-containing protein [Riemerella columbina]|uniref:DUF937 domain-containing protein n=1 Tax=Riemerella columbina TaxID=103810 RepID=UPI00036C85F2|nr:DUF937 domain-containing protein [Riemerella columbina]
MSLLDLITGSTGSQVAEKAESKFGISKNQMMALLAVATPVIISYLRNKTKDAKEAESLNHALDKDHDGSILDDVSQIDSRQEEGNSILSHIFGNKKSEVENEISQNTGISMDKIGPVLAMLAPVIMGYIGKQKRSNQVNSGGGLSDLLGGLLGGGSSQGGNPINDLLGSVMGGGSNQSSGGGLGDILGNVLGGSSKQSKDNQGGLGGFLGSILGGK